MAVYIAGTHHRHWTDTLSDLLDLSELFGDFRDEGRAQLARLDAVLAGLDAGQAPDEAQRAELLRALHTIKGNAAMLGLRPLQELVHGVEDAFKHAPAPAVLPLETLQRAAAALHRALEAAGGAEQEQAFAPLAPLRAELADALAAPAPSAEAADDAETLDDASAAVPSAAGGARAEAPTSTEAAPLPSIPPRVPLPADSAVSPAVAPAPAARTPSPGDAPAPERRSDAGAREESLRIPFARLDPLLGQVDDLVRAVEGLRAWMAENAQALQAARLRRGAAERLEELEASASAVRRGATSLRLVAVERVFSRFPPLAAELARERGKRVRVELHGEGTELDKATSDALLDPLLHLVRNAVDHGVEPPDERRAAGKPETATVRLSAAQEGDRVRIEVEDDGRGLDRAAIERRARQLGLVAEGEALDEEEIDDLLFRPGFSTRTVADEVSGRGVGLDVVREAVSRLRGQVRVEDGDEGGTRFVLLVPLTVALVPVLFFQAAGETFAIPALDVEETLRAGAPGRTGPAETVAVHDEAVPLVRLDRVFGWAPAPDPRFVLVLRRGARAAALGADRLLAQDAAAVRALPSALGGPRGVSGAVVDARGRVVLLLDPGEMLEMNVDLYRGGTGGG
ncbi:chemotaxis protein CheA [Longimicrobium sp.]|jgi:two-component system chemotaxis sensor kinase CheA|uniref:chemotaxis protein CheA n=1 Tax=Longimicrobium sp. TaxID=2029185 RepID=UPI002EDA4A0F